MRLPPKDPAEIKAVRFQYKTELGKGATLAGVVVSVAVVVGTDPAAAAVLDGAAVIDNAAFEVLQRVTLGVAECDYEIHCLATDSAGLKHLIVATLPVRALH